MNSSNRRTVGFALELFRSHPRRTLVVFASYVGAGIAEGLGIAALLPISSLASREPSAAATGDETTLERLATNVLGWLALSRRFQHCCAFSSSQRVSKRS